MRIAECWCGATLPSDPTLVDSSQCSKVCVGDTTLLCGGDARLNVYYASSLASNQPCGYKPPTIPTTTTTTTQATSTTTGTATTGTASTTTVALCTATVTSTPQCEVKCGSWCA